MPILLARNTASQPQQSGGIDWENPITRGLVNAWHPGIGFRAAVGSFNGAPTVGNVFQSPLGWTFTTGGYVDLGTTAGRFTTDGFSVVASATPTSTTGDQAIASIGFGGWYLRRKGAQWNVLKSQTADLFSGGTVVANRTAGVGFTFTFASGTNPVGLWADGLLVASGTTAQDIRTSSVRLAFGGDGGTPETWTSGAINAVLLFNRALSDAEMRGLTANPWQVFRKVNARRWSAAVISASGPPYYPSADVSAGGWTASTGGTLASCIDEPTTPNDSDYISSSNPTGVATLNIGPLTAGTWAVKVRAAMSTGTGTLTAKLRDSGSVLDTQTQAITSTITTYTLNFTVASTADRISLEVA